MGLPPRWRYKFDRLRNKLGSALESEPAARRPRLCPACRNLVGSTATRCHVCGSSLTFSMAAASRSLSSLLPTTSPATYVIMGLNVVMFVISLATTIRVTDQFSLFGGIHSGVLDRLGASRPLPYNLTEPWRFVMATFLHGGLLHIAMNSWVLMDLGPMVEENFGSARYLFVYLFGGITGFLFSSYSGHFSVGASGAVMGLIGVMLAVTTRRGGAYMQAMRGQLIRWVVYILVFGLMVRGIDNWAHIGGLAGGFLLGRVIDDQQPVTKEARQRAQALGWIAGITILVCFALMLRNYFQVSTSAV